MTDNLKVAVVGATGMVGQQMLEMLAERRFPASEVVPVASPRSAGRKVTMGGRELEVVALAPEVFDGVDVALFSAGGSISREWAPVAAERGAIVVDNSSAWRMDPECPLVVPEVNLDAAHDRPRGIIANPNCSTIQMVVALKPIHDAATLRRVVVSTYQAISGAGAKAVAAFEQEMADFAQERRAGASGDLAQRGIVVDQLAGSLLMNWKVDAETGYQEEELKMVNETRKILGDESIRVSPTAVRVPVITSHCESITLETEQPIDAAKVRELLGGFPGVELADDFAHGVYPDPLGAAGKDPVYVGRIRDDIGNPGGVQMWVVADNLRKGAALNAIQIAEAVTGAGRSRRRDSLPNGAG